MLAVHVAGDHIWAKELCVIEHIECFQPKLDAAGFMDSYEFFECHVEVIESRTKEVAGRVFPT